MNIVVAGDSLMALQLVEALMLRHQVVCLHPADATQWGSESLNAEIVTGEITSPQALESAQVNGADVFVACSRNDEQNIVACMTARRLGAQKTMCVLTGRTFLTSADDATELARSLGIDDVVRPIDQLAQEMLSIILVPGALEFQRVAGGRLELFRFAVAKKSEAVGRDLASLDLPDGARLVHLRRGDEFVVPHGGTQLQPGDKVIAMGLPGRLVRLGAVFHGDRKIRREAVVIGGGRVGRSVTRGLMRSGWSVKVVELNRERCDVVAERTEALVLHGDGTDVEFLEQEQLANAPVVVAVTSSDERNLLVSLVVKQLGNARVITRADRLSNERLFEKVGVDVVRSAKGAAIRTIVSSIDPYESEIHAELEHGTACVMEITVDDDNPPVLLSRIRPPAYAVVGAVLRGPETLIPTGQDELLPKDHLFVFCARSDEAVLRRYFERPTAA